MSTNVPVPKPNHETPSRLLDTAEVAHQLHLSERQVSRLRQSGKLGAVRLTGTVARHTQAQVDAYVAACTIPAKAAN